MPQNRYVIRVDPQGQAMVVDILDTSGTSVPAYDSSQFAAALRTLPLSIDSPTEFWVAAGAYDVSAKVNGAEIASGAGTPVRVTVSDDPVTVRPVVSASELPAVSGGSSPVANIVAKAIDYTASSGDVVLADASGGNFAVTLPVPVATATVTVKNVGASGTVTIAPHAAELIDGASGGIPVTRAMSSYLLASDGTDWWVI